MSFFYYLISFFLIINVIVFVHEYGHFLAAKQVGVGVSKFSIGIGPEIYGFDDKYGTRWCFSLLPVGGYVMMLGDRDIVSSMEDEESLKNLSEREKERVFFAKSSWEKMCIAFCGPFFNYIYAFIVIVGMSFFYGVPTYNSVVGEVLKDSPAERMGIKPGDKIISVDDYKVEKYRDIVLKVTENESRTINFVVERNGVQRKIEITPEIKETKKPMGGIKRTKILGIRSAEPVFIKRTFLDSVKLAILECISATKEMCGVFVKLFEGKKSIDDFGGIIRMAEVAGDLSKSGNFALLIMFTVTLSLNLGFINLFPLPVLDGGRILFSFIEQVTGKKLNRAIQEYTIITCAILLMFLMLIMTVNDVLRIGIVSKFVSSIMG